MKTKCEYLLFITNVIALQLVSLVLQPITAQHPHKAHNQLYTHIVGEYGAIKMLYCIIIIITYSMPTSP